ncbi:hypothetical protein PLICRDRAFT_49495 [Plicaturopsis crispa FD-325 SS-3]|nr:hypothetical protein PLICRDRAFT_49495 [Plicaturopsis crispa FD-325 SS-3]
MLKRQRPVSPPASSSDIAFVPDDDMPSHRDPKRRRTAAPVLDGRQRGWAAPDNSMNEDDDEEEFDEEEDEVDAGTGPHDLVQAYKSANSVLHDLHAEHQHRMMFSSHQVPQSISHPSRPPYSPHEMPPQTNSYVSSDKTLPTLTSRPSGHLYAQEHSRKSSYPGNGFETRAVAMEMDEVQKVKEQYVSRNKLLGSLFLERRRALHESPDEHNHN